MFSESLIIKSINQLILLVMELYKHSFIAAVSKKIGTALKSWVVASTSFRIAEREGFLSRNLKFSGIYNFFLKIISWPLKVLRSFYRNLEDFMEVSLIIRLFKALLRKFNLLMALTLLVFMIVPYAKWHNSYATAMMIALFVLFFLKSVMIRSASFNEEGFDFYFLVFAASVVLSLVFSIFPRDSLRFIVFYINCFVFVLLMVSSIRSIKELSTFIEILLIGITLTGIYGMWQGVHGVAVNLAQVDTNVNSNLPGRIYSTLGNANDYAELLVLFLPFYFVVIANAKSILKKLLFVALAAPPLASLVLTFSRSSWIGFAIAVMVIVLFKNWKLIPFMILAALFAVPFLPKTIYMRLMTISNSNDSSMDFRTQIYKTVQPMLKDYWATGVGLGSDAFRGIVKNYYLYTKGKPPVHCHNLLLQTWLETGIVGVTAFIAFIVGIFKRSLKNILGECDKKLKNILIAGIASITGIMVVSMAEYIWFNQRLMLLFWIVIGISLTAISVSKKSSLLSEIHS